MSPRVEVAESLRHPVRSMLREPYLLNFVSFYLVRISFGLELQKLNFWIFLSSCFPEFLSKGAESGFSNLTNYETLPYYKQHSGSICFSDIILCFSDII